jgi:hypothetical protein
MPTGTLSVSVRLRRTKTESAHVSVLITDELMRPNDEGDGRKLAADKIMSEALELGKNESTKWEQEGEPQIEPHPLQTLPGNESIQ